MYNLDYNSDLVEKCKTSSILADDGNQNESFPVMNSDAKMAVILSKYISHPNSILTVMWNELVTGMVRDTRASQ